jgi:arsenite methyltransferase
MTDIREEVRARYAEAATEVLGPTPKPASCCGGDAPCCSPGAGGLASEEGFGSELYAAAERGRLPDAALLASLGCGNPTAVADLEEGQTVLDLGSGGGIDVLLSAARVGPTGKAYGLDMTDEMLELALANKIAAGADNVEFLKGYIEAIPLPAETVDVIISNCVINLAADKDAVFYEMHRVLRPGGRIGVSDVVASSDLTAEQRAERGSYVGCIAGALSFEEYEEGLVYAGFTDITIVPSHEVADGMFSTIVKATRAEGERPSSS